MWTILVATLLFVAAQATSITHKNVYGVQQTINELPGAPKYPDARVIAGTQAERGQFPYQAALYLNGRSFCGGSLISQRWVLTAAHCASGISTFTVYLGALDLDAENEEGRVVIETTQAIVHPSYVSLLASNDVAIVNLGQDVTLNSLIQTISLASGSDTFEGVAARVSGWGKTSDASTSVSPQLNYVDVSIISNTVCKETFSFYIRSTNICTQGLGESGVCNGDSGGPLIDQASGLQIGVASFVSGAGCQSGSPNGFARVSSFASWIAQNTGITL